MQFINEPSDAVLEALEGLVQTSDGRLALLDGFPDIKVVLRRDWNKSKVAVISGGGSGHEPAHSGLVGQGLLTAAVCGNIFASPPVDAILAAIVAVTGPRGCLLVVKNYTGDRLNFGLAAERARALGLSVEMLVIGDDIALPGTTNPRGIAGTLFVHKTAGALADMGADLATVTKLARKVANETKTIGMALGSCRLPGQEASNRIAAGLMEVGLGIHGEPGAGIARFCGADAAMEQAAKALKALYGERPIAVLLNNLGHATQLEMGILTRALSRTSLASQIEILVGPSALMTALDMHGFSLSAVPLSPRIRDLLQMEVTPDAWPGCKTLGDVARVPLPDIAPRHMFDASANARTEALILQACAAMIAAEGPLNRLDVELGDGDTGSSLAQAAQRLQDRVDQLPLDAPGALLSMLGQEFERSMGGSFGVLLAILFTAAGEASRAGAGFCEALKTGLKKVQEIGGAKPGDRTFLDALVPAISKLPRGVAEAARAARAGANKTATLAKANAGRAGYLVNTNLEGHIDPGAEAVARLFEAVSETLTPQDVQ